MNTYYSLSLLNNVFSVGAYYENFGNVLHRDRIANVICKDKTKNYFESSLVIGQEIEGKMFDVISGKEIMYSSIYDEPNPNICYYSKKALSKEEVANELRKFKVEDIKRYVKSIETIEKESIANYQKYKKCMENIPRTVFLSKVI